MKFRQSIDRCVKALILLAVTIAAVPIYAQSEAEEFKVDPQVYAYYQRCVENLQSPLVLKMADTLFQMAGQKDDPRMQAVALSTVLDYYYYKGVEDSIISNVNKVKAFALKIGQPKYYYFAWGKRLIQFYIKQNRLNTALYEAEKMLAEAQERDDEEGLANCYNTLSAIYKAKGMTERVFESRLKEVEMIEKYDLDRYNISLCYIDLARYYMGYVEIADKEIDNNAGNVKDFGKALEMLKLAEKNANTVYHRMLCQHNYLKYHLTNNEPDKALHNLDALEEMFQTDKRLGAQFKSLYLSRYMYYNSTKQYAKAMEALDQTMEEYKKQGDDISSLSFMYTKGCLYYKMHEYQNSAEMLLKYINTRDSVSVGNDQATASEYAALLGVERLALKAKEDQLRYISIIIGILVILLGIVGFLLYKGNRLNRKLKASEAELLDKNASLTESEEKLSIAKEKAEQASMMKSVFIRNMTHEIRTPLNSIVGFSELISDMMEPDNPAREYADIIKENNSKMLKLIDDVLDMSDLESGKQPDMHLTDANKCCEESVKSVIPYIKEGVKLSFDHSGGALNIISNSGRISQVLFNLLHNAAKVTEQGSITLGCGISDDKRIIFTVTDTGPGIPAERQEDIFERFVKIDEFSQGFGLGLSICRLLAQKLGGNITIDPRYTAGSRFVFWLPYVPAE